MISDYEQLRNDNILRNDQVIAKIFGDTIAKVDTGKAKIKRKRTASGEKGKTSSSLRRSGRTLHIDGRYRYMPRCPGVQLRPSGGGGRGVSNSSSESEAGLHCDTLQCTGLHWSAMQCNARITSLFHLPRHPCNYYCYCYCLQLSVMPCFPPDSRQLQIYRRRPPPVLFYRHRPLPSLLI